MEPQPRISPGPQTRRTPGTGAADLQVTLAADAAVAGMIDGLGSPDFPALFFDALLRIVPFDLSMVSVYDGRALVSYDTAERSPLGHSGFLERYRRTTFRYNPFFQHHLRGLGTGLYRMEELARPPFIQRPGGGTPVVLDAGEEIGFLTPGWPRRLRELAIAVRASGERTAQISLYRAGGSGFPDRELRPLRDVVATVAAVYRRHLSGTAEACPPDRRVDRALARSGVGTLSARERQIIGLILEGRSTREIARSLAIAEETVRTHRKHAYQKLEVGSRVELLSRCFFESPAPDRVPA